MSHHSGNPRPEVVPFIPVACKTVLDVGCSDGLFAEQLQTQRPGVVVDGVEPDRVTADAATSRMRTVYRGRFPDAVPASEQYDCVTFLDSLEHMPEPWDILRATTKHLTPTGVVVASLPNIRSASALKTLLIDRDWPWDDSGIYDRTHLRFFTQKSMWRLFETSGYLVESCDPINETRSRKAHLLSKLLGREVLALQFVVVAHPV